MHDAPKTDRLLLQRMRLIAQAELPPQAAHDVEASGHLDPVTQRMVLRLRTRIYKTELGEETKTVHIDERVPVEASGLRYLFGALALLGLLTVAVLVPLQLDYALLVGVSALIAAGAYFLWPRETHINRRFKVTGLYWHKFPGNQHVYPKGLGAPILHVGVAEPVPDRGEP